LKLGGLLDTSSQVCGFTVVGSFCHKILTLLFLCGTSLWMKGVSNDVDLLNPPPELEQKKHKLKRLVPSPNSFFMVRGLVH
jgi:hypothetical protein